MKKKPFLILCLLLFAHAAITQDILPPGHSSLDRKLLKEGRSEMGYYMMSGRQMVEICTFEIEIKSDTRALSIFTNLRFIQSGDQWIDTIVSDINTFKPIYHSSFNKDRDYVLRYGKEVTGYHYDKQLKKRTAIKDATTESFFDGYAYPYLLGLLPLAPGYKKDLLAYEYLPQNNKHVKTAHIEEVKNSVFTSDLTGQHKVWQVSILEESTNNRFDYFIDKETRKIWRVDIFSKGQHLVMIDKEIDYNPIKAVFNKQETLKLVKDGSGVISGEVFARDNENEGALKGMAVLNINKKQYAPAGTSVILIPYTAFFKEWVKLNESSRKKGRAIPLPKEAAECIKQTTVYDDHGHFEFVNLMPGDYLLYTEFGYVHTSRRTEVVGYTDTYINGMFQGSSQNTRTYSYGTNSAAAVKKVVTIEKEGQNINVKLKKTK
ncbi:MAG TPA: hypothetical protein VFR58_15320 [Flavisolibacter sp.]|nr:hypothetical protein [Flavisolibacter sp.]